MYKSEKTSSDMSITNNVGLEILTLPLHSCMDEEASDHVIASIQNFFEKNNPKLEEVVTNY